MAAAAIWTNWAGEQTCAPEAIERPGSEDELCEVVARAAAAGHVVKAVGSGHSFTDCACTDGVMIDLSRMTRVLAADPATGLVTVEAGARLHALGPELAERGLALENQGDIDRQSVSGATATATHGTGARFQNLSARVASLRLVTAAGEVLELSPESDPEAYLAARVSVGALGVVSAMTIECVPLYTLHRVDGSEPLDETLDRLDEHVEGNDHFEFFWFPWSDRALLRRTQRDDAPPDPTPEWRRRINEDLIENRLLSLLTRTGRAFPGTVPRLNRMITRLAGSGSRVDDHAYRVYATTRNVRFTEMEYALPREAAREAVERVKALIERRRLPIAFPLEVRFAASDDAFLSTTHGRDTCYVAVHQTHGMEFETFFRAAERIFDDYGGRPHWGKRHYQSAAVLRERYPEWERFQAVRRRLDPGGAFTNDYVRRALGPIG
jgi:L-gulono-1,4-lactone dehydrogenase